jgi:hypothetical protein
MRKDMDTTLLLLASHAGALNRLGYRDGRLTRHHSNKSARRESLRIQPQLFRKLGFHTHRRVNQKGTSVVRLPASYLEGLSPSQDQLGERLSDRQRPDWRSLGFR